MLREEQEWEYLRSWELKEASFSFKRMNGVGNLAGKMFGADTYTLLCPSFFLSSGFRSAVVRLGIHIYSMPWFLETVPFANVDALVSLGQRMFPPFPPSLPRVNPQGKPPIYTRTYISSLFLGNFIPKPSPILRFPPFFHGMFERGEEEEEEEQSNTDSSLTKIFQISRSPKPAAPTARARSARNTPSTR